MEGWPLLWLLLVWARACLPSDGSAEAPFYVSPGSTVTPATGSSCAPFPSIAVALGFSSNLPVVSLVLLEACSFPYWNITTSLTVKGNSHTVDLTGTIEIYGKMKISGAKLTCAQGLDKALDLFGGFLTLIDCEIVDFPGVAVMVRGQVTVATSLFRNNTVGVFSVIALGGGITVTDSKFHTNAAVSGAVFLVVPVKGEAATNISVSNCEFLGNGAKAGNGVLVLNDLGTEQTAMDLHTIAFSGCSFAGQKAAPFQVTSQQFAVRIDSSSFTREPQIVTGSLYAAVLTVSNCTVTSCLGPPLSLTLLGQVHISATNFTDIDPGPIVYVSGRSPDTTLVHLHQINIKYVNNPNTAVSGVILNANSVTILMTDIHLSHFSVVINGIFTLSQTVLYTQNLVVTNGTAQQSVIGLITACTVEMNNTLFDQIRSRGSMCEMPASLFKAKGLVFRNITGFWDVNLAVYTTNFFVLTTDTVAILDQLEVDLVVPGSTLLYAFKSNLHLSNSRFTGPLGMGLFGCLGGKITVTNCTFGFTAGRTIAKLLLGGYIHFDVLRLRDLTLTSPIISISSYSDVHILSLILTNVTTLALSKGQDYSLTVDRAEVTKSAVSWLAYFSIAASLKFGSLYMQDTTGQLFSLFSSNVTISQAEISTLRTSQMLIYLSNSYMHLHSATLHHLSFNYIGDLATLIDRSALHLTSVTLRDISGFEHGLISLQQAYVSLAACTVTRLNVSLVVAEEAEIAISGSEVTEIGGSFEGKTLSMLPNGGVISCFNCPIVSISHSRFSEISANQGGVLYLQMTAAKQAAEATLSTSTFENCAGMANGGVLYAVNQKVTAHNCTFVDNHANMGGVFNFQSAVHLLQVTNSSFSGNSATLDGSCVRWTGPTPLLLNNSYQNNSAIYGNPQASTPHHFVLMHPTESPVIGVTGQSMDQPLLIGVYDSLGQLIVTDNSTLIVVSIPVGLIGYGNKEILVSGGLASFSLLISPYSTAVSQLTFYSTHIANLTIDYKFRDCQPGEIRSLSGCLPCPKNSYSFRPSDASCLLCFAHAECYGRTEVYLAQEYWRTDNLTDNIYICLIDGACSGGFNSDCAEGYNSTLCGSCAEGYYKYGLWRCRDCEEEVPPAASGLIITALVVLSVTIPPQLFLRKDGKLFKIALLYRVLSDYSHMVLFAVLLHVRWPVATLSHHEIWRTLASLGHTLMHSSCHYTELGMNDYFFQVGTAAFYPILLVFSTAVLWTFANIWLKHSFKELCIVVFSVSFVAIYIFLPSLSATVISMYQCTTVAGKKWLVADTSQECWTDTHLAYIYKVTIPLLLFLGLVHIAAIWCVKSQSTPGLFRYIKEYMAAGYARRHSGWEMHVMWLRALLVWLSLAYPFLDTFSQIMLFACILGWTTHARVIKMPYVSKWLNCLAIVAPTSVVIIVFTAAQGSEAELTALSTLGSAAVLGTGCIALFSNLSEGNKPYIVEVSQSQQNLSMLPLGDVSDSLHVPPPPSSPDFMIAKEGEVLCD